MIHGAIVERLAFARGLREALTPRMRVSEWADKHRVLSKISSAEPGKWTTARTPYLKEIMDCLSEDSRVQEIVFQKCVQIGGTECGNNWIGQHVQQGDGAMMLVLPTQSVARKMSVTRVTPMLRDTPSLRGRVRTARSREAGNTTLMKYFADGAGVLIFAGANSASDLKSQPAGLLFMDELEEYPDDTDGQGDPEELISARATTFTGRRKKLKVSTPTIAGGRIDMAYRRSDQRLYNVPCPHCNHYQTLRFSQLRWDTRKRWERVVPDTGEIVEAQPDEAGAVERDTGELLDVFYECEQCSKPIHENAKPQMLARGRWVATQPGPDRAAGFKINALYSPLGWFSWRQVVLEHFKAKEDTSGIKLKTFTNQVLGEAYDEPGTVIDEHFLKRRIEAWRVGTTVPKGALLLTAGCDVQGDRLEIRVWGYGREAESWLVDRHVIYGSPAEDTTWAALAALLDKTWPHELGGKIKVTTMAVDAGDGNTTHFVRAFARRYAHNGKVIATKGQAAQGKALLGRGTLQDVSWKGKFYKGGVKLWPVGADTGKSAFYARLRIETPGPGYVHIPGGLPDEEFTQLTAEKLVTRILRGGHAKHEWTLPSGRRNEALDCRVLADAAAEFLNVRSAKWDQLEADYRQTQADLFVDAMEKESVDAEREPDTCTDATPPTKQQRQQWQQRPTSNWVTGGGKF